MITDLQVRLLLPAGPGDAFWAAALGEPVSDVERVPTTGPAQVQVLFETDDVAAERDRLLVLGAVPDPAGTGLRSPGGWPFGLTGRQGRRRSAAVRWPAGHRSRLVQVAIDSPAGLHDREVSFWTSALGWDRRPVPEPEFAGKLIRPGASVQFLLHRLGPDDGGTEVRAHLDLGTDDLEAEATRLVEAGAVRLWAGDGWITLRDPAGALFCVSRNSPDAP